MKKNNTFVFMKFKYYKRQVNGQTIELHLQEERNNSIIGKVFPESDDCSYKESELTQLSDVNAFLDEGLRVGIFDSQPIPNQAN